MLPQANARLLRVERTGGTTDEGFSEDYDRPATDDDSGDAGENVWEGSVAAYLVERRERVIGEGGRNLLVRRWISIDSSLPRIDFEEEDTLTFEHKGVEATGTVEAVEDRAMPGVAGTTRLTLAPA